MPEHTPRPDAAEDLRLVADDLRARGATDAADRIDALADDLAGGTATGPPEDDDQAFIDAVSGDDDPAVDGGPLGGTSALLTARIDPPVGADLAAGAIDEALSGIEHRVLAVDEATGCVEIEAAVEAPPPAGCILVAGSFTAGGTVHDVVVVTGAGPVPDLATALGDDGEVPDAPVAFRVTYRLTGGRLDDETILPVLDAASRTLSYFGDLVPVTVVHLADHTVVDYGVLNPGPVSTARVAQRATGWGGTITVPGVGEVSAALEL